MTRRLPSHAERMCDLSAGAGVTTGLCDDLGKHDFYDMVEVPEFVKWREYEILFENQHLFLFTSDGHLIQVMISCYMENILENNMLPDPNVVFPVPGRKTVTYVKPTIKNKK
jgi:hypothetical protein